MARLTYYVLPFAVKADMAEFGLSSLSSRARRRAGTATARNQPQLYRRTGASSRTTSGAVISANGHLRVGPVVTNIAQLWDANQAGYYGAPVWHCWIDKWAGFRHCVAMSRNYVLGRAFMPLRVGKSPLSWLVLRPEQLVWPEPVIRGGAVDISPSVFPRRGPNVIK